MQQRTGFALTTSHTNRLNVITYILLYLSHFLDDKYFKKTLIIKKSRIKTRSKIWSNYNSLIIKVSSNILSVFYKKSFSTNGVPLTSCTHRCTVDRGIPVTCAVIRTESSVAIRTVLFFTSSV